MKSSSNPLLRFIKDPNNLISAVLGSTVTVLTLLFSSKPIPMWILGVCMIVMFLLMWALLCSLLKHKDLIYSLRESKIENSVIKPIKWMDESCYQNTLIIKNYDFLSPKAFVTIYLDNDFEEYFCTGIVLDERTSKGYYMIKILKINRYYQSTKMPDINQIIIKPIVTLHYFEEG